MVTGFKALAWKCITIDPGWAYTPKAANEVGSFAILISLRPTRIPIGGGQELRDRFEDLKLSYDWLDNLDVGIGANFQFKDRFDSEEKHVSVLLKAVYAFSLGK